MPTALIKKLERLKAAKEQIKAKKALKSHKQVPWQYVWTDGGKVPPSYKPVHIAGEKFKLLLEPARYKVFHGGRGGAKSRTFARILLLLGTQLKLRILCAREVQKSIADSVKKLLDDEIDRLELGYFYRSIQNQIIGANGTEFFFAGLHKNSVSSVKSMEDIDICWVEEAQTLSAHSLEVLTPTIRKEGSEIWFSFNPRFKTDAVYDRFIEGEPPPRSLVVQVGWQDNRFFPDVLEEERQWMEQRDPEKYAHIWGGSIITMSEARIFKNWKIEAFETPSNAKIYLGADWGFSVDPSCIVGCWFDDATRTLYIDRESYEETTDIAQLGPLFERCPQSKEFEITFDSSKPEIGKEMKKKGYRMKPCRKGAGSVIEGIEYLQGWNIVVHPSCKHTIFELSNYAYKTDPATDEVIQPAVPADKHNHCVDSLRYATESRWRGMVLDWMKTKTR